MIKAIENVQKVYLFLVYRYGWEFLCMVQGEDVPNMTRMYIHR